MMRVFIIISTYQEINSVLFLIANNFPKIHCSGCGAVRAEVCHEETNE